MQRRRSMLKQMQNYLGYPSAHPWTVVLSLFELFIIMFQISRMPTGFLQRTSRGSRPNQCKYPDSCSASEQFPRRLGSDRSGIITGTSPRGRLECHAINQTQIAIEKSKAPPWLFVLNAQQAVTWVLDGASVHRLYIMGENPLWSL